VVVCSILRNAEYSLQDPRPPACLEHCDIPRILRRHRTRVGLEFRSLLSECHRLWTPFAKSFLIHSGYGLSKFLTFILGSLSKTAWVQLLGNGDRYSDIESKQNISICLSISVAAWLACGRSAPCSGTWDYTSSPTVHSDCVRTTVPHNV
jgi:hypothetical protein